MKRLFGLLGMMAALALPMHGEGYQVNTLSARQGGMAHTGVAQKLDAESMYFNPAGLGFMDKSLSLSGSFNAVLATAKAKVGDVEYETDNGASTPFMINAAFSIYDNLKAGITFYTPYGSGINWGESWPGAVLNQSVSLKSFTVQPTVAWRPLPSLSIGAGLMISWGDVNLNKGLVNPSSMDAIIGLLKMAGQLPAATPEFDGTMPASVNLTGSASIALGANVGVMWDITDRWTVGAQFRTQSTMKVKSGTATVNYINSLAQTLLENEIGMIDKANYKAEMPLPWVFTFGASYKPADKWIVAFDAQWTGWKAYKSLDIEFLETAVSKFNQHLTKGYKNSWAFRLGSQYSVTERCQLRAGLILDLSPVNKEYYNPETPGMTKIEPSLGVSFQPIKNVSVDVSMLYVAGLGKKNASCSYPDLLAAKVNSLLPTARQLPLMPTFEADYTLHAFVPSIGISYQF